MTFDEYKEEILNGVKIEWYGTMVPKKLLTPRVHVIANMIVDEINKMESEVSDMRKGKERDIKEGYISNIWINVKHLPYTNNGLISDSYMAKYRRIIKESEEKGKKTKPKVRKTRKPKVDETTKPKETTSKVSEEIEKPDTQIVKGRRGKSNNLIFGK